MYTQGRQVAIQELMSESGVGFGTSGARGLVTAMTDRICYAYTLAFLQHMGSSGQLTAPYRVAVGGDLRPSTPGIMQAVARAITDSGATAVNYGPLPSPALALYGIEEGIASIMVTGSHIPDDRNGIKFNTPQGEILKPDEAAIRQQQVTIPDGLFDDTGSFLRPQALPAPEPDARSAYLERYLGKLPPDALQGLRIGVYEHSGVARDILPELLTGLGASVTRLGRSDSFIPVDTEAIRPQDVELGKTWATEHRLDAIVSTDGDADRPLVSDESGNWLRGDLAGILCARYLGITHLATPVSSNTAVERCGWFDQVTRTRIGSPYVIAAMQQMAGSGQGTVAGYEANGGFLLASRARLGSGTLTPLPTRDAVIVILSVLLLARKQRLPVSKLLQQLPPRFTASNRLEEFPTAASRKLLQQLDTGKGADYSRIENIFGNQFGRVQETDQTDGLRITFESGEIAHLRPSGNAPELRCYNEAGTEEKAADMNRICLKLLDSMR
jgi:phosphomannomutase